MPPSFFAKMEAKDKPKVKMEDLIIMKKEMSSHDAMHFEGFKSLQEDVCQVKEELPSMEHILSKG